MQVRVKENVKWGDKFYNKGDLLDMSSLADEKYFEEVGNERGSAEPDVAEEGVKPKRVKKGLAR